MTKGLLGAVVVAAVAAAWGVLACAGDDDATDRSTTTVLVVSAEAQRICDILDEDGVEDGVDEIIAAVHLFGSGSSAHTAGDAIVDATEQRCPAHHEAAVAAVAEHE